MRSRISKQIFRLADGKADWYRNRWVRAGKVIDALGVADPGGPIHSDMDFAANTNVIGHAGKTLAIVEAGGRPIELSYELETVNGRIEGDFALAVEGKFGPKEARGKLNGGGEALRCETVNGTIRLLAK